VPRSTTVPPSGCEFSLVLVVFLVWIGLGCFFPWDLHQKRKWKIRIRGEIGSQAPRDPQPTSLSTFASLSFSLTGNHWPPSGITVVRHASPARQGGHWSPTLASLAVNHTTLRLPLLTAKVTQKTHASTAPNSPPTCRNPVTYTTVDLLYKLGSNAAPNQLQLSLSRKLGFELCKHMVGVRVQGISTWVCCQLSGKLG